LALFLSILVTFRVGDDFQDEFGRLAEFPQKIRAVFLAPPVRCYRSSENELEIQGWLP
jgi:hypothetical protein